VRTRLYISLLFAAAVAAGGSAAQTRPTPSTAAQPAPIRRVVTQTFDASQPGARSPRNANYDIDVRLDHARRALDGRETIRWRNITAQPTNELRLHLFWNAWRNLDSTWMRERRLLPTFSRPRDEAWGSIDVRAIRLRQPDGSTVDVTSQMRYIAPDDGNADDRTVLSVPVAAGVQPNETLQVEVEWTAKVPRTFSRTGYIDDYYFFGHWFPKIGVLEDSGWNTHQFHSATEFYADYGVYDVDVTVPRGWVVGASGRQAQRIDNADGTTTHRYHGEDIHDFAWTTSPRYLEFTQTFGPVQMRLLLQPEHRGQEDRQFAATVATLIYYGEWFGAYPYDHITIVDPAYQSGTSGMEYPTLFTSANARWIAPREVTVPEATNVHEMGHQWWHTVVGNNEFEHAWMDEGINTYATALAIQAAKMPNYLALRFFGTFIPWVMRDIQLTRAIQGNRLPTYRTGAEGDAPETPTFKYWPSTANAITYDKTAVWLHMLEGHLGWETMQRILATYFDRWKFRHPKPQDFFDIVNEVSGQDMTWFFDQVYRSSNTFDYAVQEANSERVGENRYRTTVVAQRLGEATFPIEVRTTFDGGEQVTERWDGRDRRVTYVYERPARAAHVQVDPNRMLLLDVNYTNNSRTLTTRGDDVSVKWSLKWMVWLQDLMLTYGFFV
jgi:aminopeptidase N